MEDGHLFLLSKGEDSEVGEHSPQRVTIIALTSIFYFDSIQLGDKSYNSLPRQEKVSMNPLHAGHTSSVRLSRGYVFSLESCSYFKKFKIFD